MVKGISREKIHPCVCLSLQTPLSVLKLEGWTIPFRLFIQMPKKLRIRFLKFCLEAEIWGVFLSLGWARQCPCTLAYHQYEEPVCNILALSLPNWGRRKRAGGTDRQMLAIQKFTIFVKNSLHSCSGIKKICLAHGGYAFFNIDKMQIWLIIKNEFNFDKAGRGYAGCVEVMFGS